MEAPRDLYLTAQGQLCEASDLAAAFLFHRRGQLITPQEDVTYHVTAYLERTTRAGERAERERIIAEAKMVQQTEVEDKAVAGPSVAPTPTPSRLIPPVVPIPDPEESPPPDLRRGGRPGPRGT